MYTNYLNNVEWKLLNFNNLIVHPNFGSFDYKLGLKILLPGHKLKKKHSRLICHSCCGVIPFSNLLSIYYLVCKVFVF